jgi:hypothetical protein
MMPSAGIFAVKCREESKMANERYDGVNNDVVNDVDAQHVSPDAVPGAHDADGTLGRTAGTGSGALAGGIVGAAAAGPVGAVVGAIAGGVLGNAAGDAAHHIGDDQDDVNVETGSGGDLGKYSGTGAGAISGAIVGSTTGPVGTVAGAVAGGMLGAAAGNAAKDMGGDGDNDNVSGDRILADGTVVSATPTNYGATSDYNTVGNDIPGVQTGGYAADGTPDTRGITEKAADAVTGDRRDDNTGKIV